MSMLEVRDLHAYYGKSHILQGVSFSVREGEIVGLLGRNGVGRSTTIKTIMGQVPPQGSIRFRGRELAGLKPHEIARLGLGYVPEERAIFPTLTVRQNLLLGQKGRRENGRWSMRDMFALFPNLEERAETVLERIGLARRRDVPAGLLSYAEQRALEIGIAIAGDPDVLLLDEPTAGMSHSETEHAVALIRRVAANKTLLMVEHDMAVVFGLADRISVLVYGRVIASGAPDEIRRNRAVQEAYLGAL